MELRDAVLLISLLLSIASFALSWKNISFTKRVKLIELRNAALFKFVELRVLVDRVEMLHDDLAAQPKAAANSRFKEIAPKIEQFRRRLDTLERNYQSAGISNELDFQSKHLADLYFAYKGGEEIERLIKALIDDTK